MKTLFQQHPDSISKYVFLERQEFQPTSIWNNLDEIPPESIFAVMKEFQEDTDPRKINASIGVIPNKIGEPYVLPIVQRAFHDLDDSNFNYQSPRGNPKFLDAMAKLFLGEDIDLEKVALQAAAGGTQANRIFADLLVKQNKEGRERKILVSDPTWANHEPIFQRAGTIERVSHLTEEGAFDFESYKEAVENAAPGDVLLIQGANTHNPTGKNFSLEQLDKIIELANQKEVIIFLDFAYLGLGDGIEEDRKFAQLAFEKAHDIGLGASASKAFTMYNKRTGALMIKVENADEKNLVEGNVARINRNMITNVPADGQAMVADILENPRKADKWMRELEDVRKHITWARNELAEALPDVLGDLKNGGGLFALLSEHYPEALKKEHIYMPNDGRLNIASINQKNIKYFIEQVLKIEGLK